MTEPTLEDVYSALAEGIDRNGPHKSEMFLAKVCLLLANELDAPKRCLNLIAQAEANMDGMRSASLSNGNSAG